MRVRVRRRGGIAGLSKVADLDTASLDADDARRAEQALRTVLEERRGADPPAHPDAFTYEFALLDDAAGRSAVLHEQEIPVGLRPLVEELEARGQVERRS